MNWGHCDCRLYPGVHPGAPKAMLVPIVRPRVLRGSLSSRRDPSALRGRSYRGTGYYGMTRVVVAPRGADDCGKKRARLVERTGFFGGDKGGL
jgi:hypothetical protein